MHKSIIGAALAVASFTAVPAAAAFFTVTPGSVFTIPGNNDFKGPLNGLGLFNYTTVGASITLNSSRQVKFEYMGSESGDVDGFKAGSLAAFFENNKAVFGAELIGVDTFASGAFTNVNFIGQGGNSNVGDESFGIFLPALLGGNYASNVLYFGFDDQINNADDNHDDFIVRVTAVPEPTTWAMLVLGFGLIGVSARRRGIQTFAA